MREITIQFRSFRDVRDFAALAGRQSFLITVGTERYRVNAVSVLGMFTLNCRKPVTASFECSDGEYATFLQEAEAFLVK